MVWWAGYFILQVNDEDGWVDRLWISVYIRLSSNDFISIHEPMVMCAAEEHCAAMGRCATMGRYATMGRCEYTDRRAKLEHAKWLGSRLAYDGNRFLTDEKQQLEYVQQCWIHGIPGARREAGDRDDPDGQRQWQWEQTTPTLRTRKEKLDIRYVFHCALDFEFWSRRQIIIICPDHWIFNI